MKTVGNFGRAMVAALLLLGRFVVVVPAAETAGPTEALPLLVGNWADPTVLKDGDGYYMTHSSFEFQPGLLIWHSKHLRSWRPVTHAVVNQEGSIWAPELIKHGGRYYLYYPAAGTNWVVMADAISGPWSKPVSIEGQGLAGLLLFGSPDVYIGLAIGADGTLRRVQEGFRRYGRTDEPAIGVQRVTLRMVNDKQDVRFYYRLDEGPWQVLQPGMEVSQAVSTPSNLRPALFVCGQGEARFEYFRCRPLETDEDRDRWLEATFRLSQEQRR